MKEVEENEKGEKPWGVGQRKGRSERYCYRERDKKEGKERGRKKVERGRKKEKFSASVYNIVMQKFPEPKATRSEFSCPFLYSLVLQH